MSMTPTPSSASWTRFSKPTPSPSLVGDFAVGGLTAPPEGVKHGPAASASGVIDSTGSVERPRLRVLPGEAGEHTGEVLRGRYELLKLLGAGGMAEVYEARFLPSDARRVAVKILRRRVAREPANVRRFAREFKILDAVEHPNLVTVRDYDRTADGRLFMVMERLEGRSLDSLGEAMTPARVIAIGIQLCDVLSVLHERGVIHRDLKPSNVILLDGTDDRIKLVDLGIARLEAAWYLEDRPYLTPPGERRLTSTGVVLGTPRYVPPEAGDGPATILWDVYALGVLLWSLACGRPPPLSWREAGSMESAPEGEHGLPQLLERTLRDAMSVDPQRRFASAVELREELEVAAADLDPEEPIDVINDAHLKAGTRTEANTSSSADKISSGCSSAHSNADPNPSAEKTHDAGLSPETSTSRNNSPEKSDSTEASAGASANPSAGVDEHADGTANADRSPLANADRSPLATPRPAPPGERTAWLRSGLALLVAACVGASLAVLTMLAIRDARPREEPENQPQQPPSSSEETPPPPSQQEELIPSLTLNDEALGCVPSDLPRGAYVDLDLDERGKLAQLRPGPGVEVLTQLCLTQKIEGVDLGAPGGKSTHRIPLAPAPAGEGEHAEP